MLDREHRLPGESQAAIGAVEQRAMGLLDTLGQRIGRHGETVVHRHDLDLAGGEVLHRMVGAVVTLMHLLGLGAERQRQHLVAEADAEDRHVLLDQRLDGRHGVIAGRRRIAGAVRQEDAIGIVGEDVLGAGRRRHQDHPGAFAGHPTQDVALGAVVDGDDGVARLGLGGVAGIPDPGLLVPDHRFGARSLLGEIEADKAAPGGGARLQGVDIELAVRLVRDHGVHGTLFADQRGEGAGVDARQGDDTAVLEPGIEVAGGAIVRRLGHIGPEDRADRAGRIGRDQILLVLVIGADIADMREGEGDDLPRIGGIGEDLLIAGEGGVEAHLALDRAGGAETETVNDRPVCQHQNCGRLADCPAFGHGAPLSSVGPCRASHRGRSVASAGLQSAPACPRDICRDGGRCKGPCGVFRDFLHARHAARQEAGGCRTGIRADRHDDRIAKRRP